MARCISSILVYSGDEALSSITEEERLGTTVAVPGVVFVSARLIGNSLIDLCTSTLYAYFIGNKYVS